MPFVIALIAAVFGFIGESIRYVVARGYLGEDKLSCIGRTVHSR